MERDVAGSPHEEHRNSDERSGVVRAASAPARSMRRMQNRSQPQPPPPCHPNPHVAEDREAVLNRGDVRNLPTLCGIDWRNWRAVRIASSRRRPMRRPISRASCSSITCWTRAASKRIPSRARLRA